MYFGYPFERTLPRKQLECHQCQWLDTLCKLECECVSVIFLFYLNIQFQMPTLIMIPYLIRVVKFFGILSILSSANNGNAFRQFNVIFLLKVNNTLIVGSKIMSWVSHCFGLGDFVFNNRAHRPFSLFHIVFVEIRHFLCLFA